MPASRQDRLIVARKGLLRSQLTGKIHKADYVAKHTGYGIDRGQTAHGHKRNKREIFAAVVWNCGSVLRANARWAQQRER